MKLYMHAGSFNHGCEAIVRSTIKMAKKSTVLYSEHPEEDKLVGLDDICTIKKQGGNRSKKNPIFVFCKGLEVLTKSSTAKNTYAYRNVITDAKKGDLYLSIGGDNYCYNANAYLAFLNSELNKRGATTGLWGCSVEPSLLTRKAIIDDMKKYAFITARESLTFEAMKKTGLNNVFLYPDPAFTLETKECVLPKQFNSADIIGVNLSPLIQKLDSSGKTVLGNYINLIKYILSSTDYYIALIPHVCKPRNDDRLAMMFLKSFFPNEERIFMVNTHGNLNCCNLKFIISKCKFLITARTHASVAGYSMNVPTLVVGYSVKALGIAKDIFGSSERYVVDIRNLNSPKQLVSGFSYIIENENSIKNKLISVMPQYMENARRSATLLK